MPSPITALDWGALDWAAPARTALFGLRASSRDRWPREVFASSATPPLYSRNKPTGQRTGQTSGLATFEMGFKMSVTVGLSLGESFAELTARAPDRAPLHARWQLARKRLSLGLGEALGPETVAGGGTLVIASMTGESVIARRLGRAPALVSTAGFEHWPQMALAREAQGDARHEPERKDAWSPLSDDLAFAATERTRADGSIAEPLDEADLARIAAKLKLVGAPSTAISFLHARANPAHEKRAAEILRGEGLAITASHELPPSAATGPGEVESERCWRAVLTAYTESALADEEREIREALASPLWRIVWASDRERATLKPSLESAFGLEAALAREPESPRVDHRRRDQRKPVAQETCLYFGLERFFAAGGGARLRDGFPWFRALRSEPASPGTFSLQPVARVAVEGRGAPAFLFETRGFEPGPMVLGKSLQPTALDVLSWRGHAPQAEGAPPLVNERVLPRIAEAILALVKTTLPAIARPDPAAVADDLEALLTESIVADLAAAGLEGPFRATGPLATAMAPLLGRRRPDWQVSLDPSKAEWAASEALAEWAACEAKL